MIAIRSELTDFSPEAHHDEEWMGRMMTIKENIRASKREMNEINIGLPAREQKNRPFSSDHTEEELREIFFGHSDDWLHQHCGSRSARQIVAGQQQILQCS